MRSSAMREDSRLGSEAVLHQETSCNLVTFRSLVGPADLLRTTVVTRLARQAEAWRRTLDPGKDYAEGLTLASSHGCSSSATSGALCTADDLVLGPLLEAHEGCFVEVYAPKPVMD